MVTTLICLEHNCWWIGSSGRVWEFWSSSLQSWSPVLCCTRVLRSKKSDYESRRSLKGLRFGPIERIFFFNSTVESTTNGESLASPWWSEESLRRNYVGLTLGNSFNNFQQEQSKTYVQSHEKLGLGLDLWPCKTFNGTSYQPRKPLTHSIRWNSTELNY